MESRFHFKFDFRNYAKFAARVLLALALAVSACTPVQAVVEAEYAAKIVGNWLGVVGDIRGNK